MSKDHFINEYRGIIHMLKEHEYLSYSDRKEFEEKEKAVSLAFIKLVKDKTGLIIPPEPQAVDMKGINSATIESAKKILRRMHRFYKAKAVRETDDSNACIKFEIYAQTLDKALLLL